MDRTGVKLTFWSLFPGQTSRIQQQQVLEYLVKPRLSLNNGYHLADTNTLSFPMLTLQGSPSSPMLHIRKQKPKEVSMLLEVTYFINTKAWRLRTCFFTVLLSYIRPVPLSNKLITVRCQHLWLRRPPDLKQDISCLQWLIHFFFHSTSSS